MALRFLTIVLLLAAAAPAAAQIEECTAYKRLIDAVAAGTDARAAERLADVSQSPRCFAVYAAGLAGAERSAFRDFVRRLEASRSDKQTGASAPSTGGTSIVSQGPVARVLSVAAEYGALTQSAAGRVVTVRGNLAGLPSVLVQREVFPYCVGEEARRGFCVDGSLLSVLKRFSFAVSFDTSRTQTLTVQPAAPAAPAAAQPVTFSAASRELSAASVHVDLINRRDAVSPEFVAAWRAKAGSALNDASGRLLAAAAFAEAVMDLDGYDAWFKASVASIRAAGRDRSAIVQAFTAALDDLAKQARAVPGFDELVDAGLGAYSRFFLAQDDLVESLALRNVLALEYTYTRPLLQPSMSNVRVVFDYPLSARTKLVANGAFTLYHAVPNGPAAIGRFRDAQVGAQLDHGLGTLAILGPAVASVAAYFQYQRAPALLNVDPAKGLAGTTFVGLPPDAKTVFTKTGNIFLVQGRLALVPPASRIKVPLSVTWSNRTELVDKPVWRGQVGISYDLDSVFAALGSGLR